MTGDGSLTSSLEERTGVPRRKQRKKQDSVGRGFRNLSLSGPVNPDPHRVPLLCEPLLFFFVVGTDYVFFKGLVYTWYINGCMYVYVLLPLEFRT